MPGKVDQLRRAAQVRDQHAKGGRCSDCPPKGRCETWNLWWPVIVELSVQNRATAP